MRAKYMKWLIATPALLLAGGCALVAGLGDEYTTAADAGEADGATDATADANPDSPPPADGYTITITGPNSSSDPVLLKHDRDFVATVRIARGDLFKEAVDIKLTPAAASGVTVGSGEAFTIGPGKDTHSVTFKVSAKAPLGAGAAVIHVDGSSTPNKKAFVRDIGLDVAGHPGEVDTSYRGKGAALFAHPTESWVVRSGITFGNDSIYVVGARVIRTANSTQPLSMCIDKAGAILTGSGCRFDNAQSPTGNGASELNVAAPLLDGYAITGASTILADGGAAQILVGHSAAIGSSYGKLAGQPGGARGTGLTVEPDGGAYVVAGLHSGSVFLTKLLTPSNLPGVPVADPTFGNNGSIEHSLAVLAVASAGRDAKGQLYVLTSTAALQARVVRFDAQGALSNTYLTNITNMSQGMDLAVLPDGSAIVLGYNTGQNAYLVAKLDASGAAAFTTPNNIGSALPTIAGAHGIAVDRVGRILVGVDVKVATAPVRMGLVRLLPDGTLDASFGDATTPGLAVLPFPAEDPFASCTDVSQCMPSAACTNGKCTTNCDNATNLCSAGSTCNAKVCNALPGHARSVALLSDERIMLIGYASAATASDAEIPTTNNPTTPFAGTIVLGRFWP
ncbi:MAG: hypothetical protein JWM74_857 [Myxococcaceae bacterium]|nr:hypothetical protein [Myxococcaceae bacterium]